MKTTTPIFPPESEDEAAPSDLDTEILFVFGGEEVVDTAVYTLILSSPPLPGIIFSYSWASPPCPFPPAPVLSEMSKMLKRTERGYRYPMVKTAAIVEGIRSGILTTTARGGGNEEGKEMRKTAKLNHN